MRSPLLAAVLASTAAISCFIPGAATAPVTFSSGYLEYTIATTGFYESSAYGAQGGGGSLIGSSVSGPGLDPLLIGGVRTSNDLVSP